eukprot:TRINITY_DN3880_c0_g1_i12.p2 TRINITY_DN3880_c0_g1~~TRINITY_DN3880_c0_g1_i12.p2  ORF type:complete len:120 (+),score=60.67 TRINITY_DN3880_c0_g1_i12:104-463(+)
MADLNSSAGNSKEEDKNDYKKVDEKEYLPSFNLLDTEKSGAISIESVNGLLSKLEAPAEGKGDRIPSEKLKEFSNGKQTVTLEDFVKDIRDAVNDPEKFEKTMKCTFKLFDSDAYSIPA